MDETFDEIIAKVVQWANDRNLTAPENLKSQTMKLVSEFGEIGAAVANYNRDEEVDGLGDVMVVAIIIGQQIERPVGAWRFDHSVSSVSYLYQVSAAHLGLFVDAVAKGSSTNRLEAHLVGFLASIADLAEARGISLKAALSHAYNQIKDRKGVMRQGIFIKESDPRYREVMNELVQEKSGAV